MTLTIVGSSHDAAYQDRLRRLARASALEHIVRFVDPVARADTAAFYAEHDALLFPSSWIEGFKPHRGRRRLSARGSLFDSGIGRLAVRVGSMVAQE